MLFASGMMSLSPIAAAAKVPKEVKACDNGNLNACADLGEKYMRGRGVKRDENLAEKILLDTCNKGNALACSRAGYLYYGITAEHAKASNFLEKGCEGNIASACGNLAHIYSKGKYLEQNYTKAAALYEKSCDLSGSLTSCLKISYYYSIGRGVPEDDIKSIQILQKSCGRGGSLSCNNLAAKYVSGEGIPKDYTKAIKLYKSSCKSKTGYACLSLARIYETGGEGLKADRKKAAYYYKKSCKKANSRKSCQKATMLSKQK